MLEAPQLAAETVKAALKAAYGIDAAAVEFLPIGYDFASSVFRVTAGDGTPYFLKARTGGGFSAPSLAVPFQLKRMGVPLMPAPLATRAGALWIKVDGFALSLFDFIEGETGTDAGLSDDQWRLLGRTTRQIHQSRLPQRLAAKIPQDNFRCRQRGMLDKVAAAVGSGGLTDPHSLTLAGAWRQHQSRIKALMARFDDLSARMAVTAPSTVLCHADLHTWNVLVDRQGGLWIVDWDEVIYAPRERDLMFVIGGIGAGLVSEAQAGCFLEGYGQVEIDRLALSYYRHNWAVQDLAEFAAAVLFAPELGELSREQSAADFASQFAPGNMVAIAESGADGL